MSNFVAIIPNPRGGNTVLHGEDEASLAATVESLYPDWPYEIIAHDKQDDRVNTSVGKDRKNKSKFASDEFKVHQFMGTVLNYTPASNVGMYTTRRDEMVNILSIAAYRYSVYNATTHQRLARVFDIGVGDEQYVVKVTGNEVTEYYQVNGIYNGIPRFAVAHNVDTHEVIEYYEPGANGIQKFSLQGELLAVTNGNISELTPEQTSGVPQNVLSKSFAWSQKQYGLILEYIE